MPLLRSQIKSTYLNNRIITLACFEFDFNWELFEVVWKIFMRPALAS